MRDKILATLENATSQDDLFLLVEKIVNEQYSSDPMGDMVTKMGMIKALFPKAADAVMEVVSAQWISVEDRMPETVGSYLCVTNDGLCAVCWVNQVGWWTVAINNKFSGDMGEPFICDSKPVEREVIFWMPLPPPPQSLTARKGA